MPFKFISALLLSLIFTLNANAAYLETYDGIKAHLLKGGKLKVIVNDKTDCKLVSRHGPIPFSPNTYSIDATTFIVKAATGHILLTTPTDLNAPAPEKGIPPNYHSLGFQLSPQEEITIEETAISLFDYSVAVSFVSSCVIGNEHRPGVKFITY